MRHAHARTHAHARARARTPGQSVEGIAFHDSQPGGHPEQLAHGDGGGGRPEELYHRAAVHGVEQRVDLLSDVGGEVELPRLDELEDPGGDERLGAAAVEECVARADVPPGPAPARAGLSTPVLANAGSGSGSRCQYRHRHCVTHLLSVPTSTVTSPESLTKPSCIVSGGGGATPVGGGALAISARASISTRCTALRTALKSYLVEPSDSPPATGPARHSRHSSSSEPHVW